MLPGLDVETLLTNIERHRVTATAVVPTIIYLLLDHAGRDAYDITSLQTVIYAGAPMAPERLRQALEEFGPIFIQTYAGTEQGYVSCLRKHEHAAGQQESPQEWVSRLASAGRPMFGVQVSIQDDHDTVLPTGGEVGEICTRQLGQMLGYLDPQRNSETMRGGWVHTGGDVGRMDDDGYLYLVDRKKDMVVSGGFNVFPRQVEDVLSTHPPSLRPPSSACPTRSGGRGGARHGGDPSRRDHRFRTRTRTDQHVKKRLLAAFPHPRRCCSPTSCRSTRPARSTRRPSVTPYWQNKKTRQIG